MGDEALSRLTEAARALDDPEGIIEASVDALAQALPDALVVACVYPEWPPVTIAHPRARLEGAPLDVRGLEAAVAESAVGFDRWAVEPDQRNRFVSATTGTAGSVEPIFRFWRNRAPTEGTRRCLLTRGPRALAYVSITPVGPASAASWRDGPVRRVLERVEAPLRHAGLASIEQDASLEERLLGTDRPTVLMRDDGTLVTQSPGARAQLARRSSRLEELQHRVRHARGVPFRLEARGLSALAEPLELRGLPPVWCIELDSGAAEPPAVALSPREQELRQWLELGLSNAEIASHMGIRTSTVKTMLERLYRRTGAAGRVELLRLTA
jgi:DNA-binding CsgD family transcriptional regulator